MSILDTVLNWEPLSRVRRNHALEHATLQILSEKDPSLRMAGYSDTGGFWVMGDIPLEDLQQAVDEAQVRLRAGEHRLAIHPYCGTNFVTTGLVAGSFAWLGMLGSGRSARSRMDRWPIVVSLVTMALIMSQPLGPMVQSRVTTNSNLDNLKVTSIMHVNNRGNTPVRRVSTRF
jgi:hypothetical protein